MSKNNDVLLEYAINQVSKGKIPHAMVNNIINIPEWSKVYKPDAIVLYYIPFDIITLKFIKNGWVIEKGLNIEYAQDTLINDTNLRNSFFKSIDLVYESLSRK